MQRKRGRGRRSGGSNNNNPNRHYESTGPDVKIRGSAQQILDKYLQYGRDAQTAGDRVKAEAHFQHAEHYARIVASFQKDKDKQRNKSDDNSSDDDSDDNNSDDSGSDNKRNQDDKDRNDNSGKDDGGSEKKSRGRPKRSRKNDEDDPMRVISNEDGEQAKGNDNKSDAEPEAAKASDSADDSKDEPKPRRRTYRRKTAEAADDNEGVMSTLARGRSDSSSDDTPEKSQAEAAE